MIMNAIIAIIIIIIIIIMSVIIIDNNNNNTIIIIIIIVYIYIYIYIYIALPCYTILYYTVREALSPSCPWASIRWSTGKNKQTQSWTKPPYLPNLKSRHDLINHNNLKTGT